MFASIDRVISEIEQRFQQLQNFVHKYGFLKPETLLGDGDIDLHCAPKDIDREDFILERERLRAFIISTDPDKKAKLMTSNTFELFKYIVEARLEEGLPNVNIMMRIFLTTAISNAGCERSFSKLKIIKNYLRSTMSELRLCNLAILTIEHSVNINFDSCIKDFSEKKARKVKF